MNRHHPYGGGYDSQSARRGGSPSGPGPDRSHRYSDRGGPGMRGRGFGRGRGGYGSYDGNMSQHDPYSSSQGDMGSYSNYDAPAAPQNYSYQNPYGGPYASPQDAAYNQDYSKYEVSTTMVMVEEAAPAGPFARREMTKFTTLLLRNEFSANAHVALYLSATSRQYETVSEEVRALFEEHGEIKTFFDLISTRGMVFVTYYDLRAAERARERLQGSAISGRPIDVHYSLPRDDNNRGIDRDKNQQLQGTLQVTLRNSPSGAPLDDNEVRRKFQQFGDVKSVKPVGERSEQVACEEAFDRLRHQGLQDGVMDIVLAWDTNEPLQGQPRERGDEGFHGNRGGGRGRGRGGMGRGRGRGGGGGYNDNDGGRYSGGNDYGRFGHGRGGRQDDYDGGKGRGGGYGDRHDRGGGGGYGDSGPPGGGYGAPSGGYGGPPPMMPPQAPAPAPPVPLPAAGGASDDRLEQARKVQQLLAALKQPGPGLPGGPPPPSGGMAGMPPPPPPAGPGSYYGALPPPPPPPPNAAAMPPYPPYGGLPPPPPQAPSQSSSQPPATPAPGLGGLPPNILALIQNAQQQQQQQQRSVGPPGQYGSMMMQPMNGSATSAGQGGAGAAQAQQYQQLMSFLFNGFVGLTFTATMIVLSTLHKLLSQAVTPQLHTAVLLTTSGQLIGYATDGGRRPKDEVRIVVGLAMEIWQETQEEEVSMVESELGRIVVVAVDDEQRRCEEESEYEPLMLLALNSTTGVDWGELQNKVGGLAGWLRRQTC
ncbi:hypothetical protein C0995_007093 [Termitomyces sp. Mi166|nr:hypothetical protein C0995_007093 [Termitomyces sp. Mi166\